MTDVQRWKDKVEISLDGRQIFFLFFGGAVAICLVFVAGVLIGKRIEARALALSPPAAEDPLAALDQLGDADEDEGLTFHKALAPDKAPAVEQAADDKPEPAASKAEPGAPKKAEPKPAPAAKAPPPLAARPQVVQATPPPSARPQVVQATPPPPARPQVVQATPPPSATQAQTQKKKLDVAAAHFTLQLSAFPDKPDAEEFMRKIQASGYKPFVVASEIPGKGVFYRVRVGDYSTRQAAVDAKSEFEKKQRIIAYVAKL